jgi:cytidyltransferase-like protein
VTAPASARGKVVTRAAARGLATAWRAHGLRVVLTEGVFDLLHVGHLRALAAARAQGDRLVVAVHDDASARAQEGEGHPVVLADDRALMVAALRGVDAVVVIDEPDGEAWRRELAADAYAPSSADVAEAGAELIERIRRIGSRRDA